MRGYVVVSTVLVHSSQHLFLSAQLKSHGMVGTHSSKLWVLIQVNCDPIQEMETKSMCVCVCVWVGVWVWVWSLVAEWFALWALN